MITSYKHKSCDSFAFAKSISDVSNEQSYDSKIIYYISDNKKQTRSKNNKRIKYLSSIDDINSIANNGKVYIAVDLKMLEFGDVDIIVDADLNKKSSNKDYKIPEDEMQKRLAGDSTHLDAFSTNKYTVINGKKSACIQTCFYTQNHDSIDSIARAGVVVDVKSNEKLSIKKLTDNLLRFKSFTIIYIHPSLEINYIEHDMPCDTSHPAYVRGEGEICAVVYRSLLLHFFGYCSVVSEKMRENKYIF